MAKAKWYVHVNQHIIRKNIHAKTEDLQAPIAVKRGRSGRSNTGSDVRLPAGSRIIYSPHDPILSCGARLVIECDEEPVILA